MYRANNCCKDAKLTEPLTQAFPTVESFLNEGGDEFRRFKARTDAGTNMDLERLLNSYKHSSPGSGKRQSIESRVFSSLLQVLDKEWAESGHASPSALPSREALLASGVPLLKEGNTSLRGKRRDLAWVRAQVFRTGKD